MRVHLHSSRVEIHETSREGGGGGGSYFYPPLAETGCGLESCLYRCRDTDSWLLRSWRSRMRSRVLEESGGVIHSHLQLFSMEPQRTCSSAAAPHGGARLDQRQIPQNLLPPPHHQPHLLPFPPKQKTKTKQKVCVNSCKSHKSTMHLCSTENSRY